MYALIDANNFFVSCERLFRPDLEGKPVVVLSSNDGCAISRSNEAKALGIAMGAPLHAFRDIPNGNTVISFSANFALYANISERISACITAITPRIEIYSIDESFLDLSNLDIADYEQWGRELRARILRDIGIPVSIGIAPSKTLCKIAASYAKKHLEVAGAYVITPTNRAARLHETTISDVWGIGWRLTPKLRAAGIHTAYDVASLRPRYAQQLMGVHGRQLQAELSGIRCLFVQQTNKLQQVISRGRQFGCDTSDFDTIRAAVTSLTAQACRELRREGQLAQHAYVTLRTNRNKPNYQRIMAEVHFATPSADTGTIASELVRTLEAAPRGRYSYHKAEITLSNLTSVHYVQQDALIPFVMDQNRSAVTDTITLKYGTHVLRQASELLSDSWRPKRDHLSPRYTTEWSELPVAHVRHTNT